jgi:hypothetical protein
MTRPIYCVHPVYYPKSALGILRDTYLGEFVILDLVFRQSFAGARSGESDRVHPRDVYARRSNSCRGRDVLCETILPPLLLIAARCTRHDTPEFSLYAYMREGSQKRIKVIGIYKITQKRRPYAFVSTQCPTLCCTHPVIPHPLSSHSPSPCRIF